MIAAFDAEAATSISTNPLWSSRQDFRLKDNTCIECSDGGAYFIEARINCQLFDFVKEPDPNFFSHLLPTSVPKGAELVGKVVLLIQLTVLKCGGTAVSVCASHKIADASSMCEFIKSWAAMARDHDEVVHPEFIGASMMRPTTDPSIEGRLEAPGESFITKSLSIHNRVLKTVAILPNCELAHENGAAGARSCHRKSHLGFPVVVEEASKAEVGDIVAKMRKGLTEFYNEKANRFKGENGY
ncbi:BAHD acyltransferase [Morus notabilis]|uniref:BAHD acyltransferase n=1 Tax=Morus notabilis TaxID=981085 RepID=W9QXH0_9ROSA|nr:BAHD acyltransferase [Morus notabilis]